MLRSSFGDQQPQQDTTLAKIFAIQQGNLMAKTEELTKKSEKLKFYKGRFYQENGLLNIVSVLTIFRKEYAKQLPQQMQNVLRGAHNRGDIKSCKHSDCFKCFYEANTGDFRQKLDEITGEAHKFKNAEKVSEYIDNLVRNSDCAGHPTVDLFNFRLIMPTDVFDEKEFLLMKAICDVQDLECVRGTDDNDI